jgi:ubiquitin-like modifier-activating enzyme ATG7
MASALLVEMMVSVLQHPSGAHAPAPRMATNQDSTGRVDYVRDPADHPLGLVPHQIRGFASIFQNMLISGQSYDCCSACSPKIVDEYRRSGWEFIKRALTESNYVSELSGLADVQRAADAAADDIDWDSEDGPDDEGEGELIDA